MEIRLIRHTTPKISKATCYGQLNLDVDSSFVQEAALIQKTLGSFQVDKILSSPLIRCKKLADTLFPEHDIIFDKRLMELNFGDWEGLPWTDIPFQDMNKWTDNFIRKGPPNGESFQTLINRVDDFESVIHSGKDKSVAIVTHSGVIRAFIMKYLNIPADKIFSLQLNYGAIVKITVHSEAFQQVEFIKG